MLRFIEEIILLLIQDEVGTFLPISPKSMDYAVAGAILMDLAMENRIDTDLTSFILISNKPTGDELLDPALAEIARHEPKSTRHWVEHIAQAGSQIREMTLKRLVQKEILRIEEGRSGRFGPRTKRYRTVDGLVEKEVKLRILSVLFTDEIPDPRDQMIICLADACGIFPMLLSREEHQRVASRITLINMMDLIGQAMGQAIREIQGATEAPQRGRTR